MDSLFKRIRQRLSDRQASCPGGGVVVAAFGKHPGWDDHMEDIGLQTPALVAMKRAIYVEGIGKNIDSGKWAELESRRLAVEFGHAFVWCRGSDTIAGRLWPSRDGRGRTSYPMVVCVHCRDVPLRWVHECILPRLAVLERQCRDSDTAQGVRTGLSECQTALLSILNASDRLSPEPADRVHPAARLMDHIRPELDGQGLIRILYHIDRQMAADPVLHAPQDGCEHSVHARVPALSDRTAEASILWTQLLLREYGQHGGVLAIIPHQRTWLDIIIGPPTPAQLYCLRASCEALPLTSTVPYTISREFTEQLKRKMGLFGSHDIG